MAVASASASAQAGRTAINTNTPAATPQAAPQSSLATRTTARATADEDFDLDITERRITERDFEAATDVSLGGDDGVDARGINLRVGVLARAEEMDVLLRNVRGHVRFRASLEPVLGRLRRATRATPATPPEPPSP